jgi:plastocyanin
MKSNHVIIVVLVLILLAVIVFATKDRSDNIDVNLEDNSTGTVGNTPSQTGTNSVTGGVSADVNLGTEVKEFIVTGTNFKFVPNVISVNRGDKVRIVFKNTEGFHDFKIDEYGAATAQLRAPSEEVIEFVADKVGAFEYYCSVGTHKQMGMKGTLNVN